MEPNQEAVAISSSNASAITRDAIPQMESKQESLEISSSHPSSHIPEIASDMETKQEIEMTDVGLENLGVHEPALATWRFFVILAALNVGLFMALMDFSILSTALYTISVEFAAFSKTVWAALAYTLADTGCAVFFTRLSDVFGRKAMLLTSFFFFTCFSVACGFAQNVEELILFRILQGVGGTGLYALTMVVCPEISPPKYLPLVVGTIGMTVAVASVVGPSLGGFITGTTTWRWIFWLNGPIGGTAMVILLLVWPSSKDITMVADSSRLKQLDYLGATMNAVSSICLVICLQQVGIREYQWSSPANIGLFTLAMVASVSFFLWQWFISRGKIASWILPHLPWRVLTHRPMGIAILCTVLTGFVQFTAIFTIPLRAEIVNFYTPVKSGLSLLPLGGATAVGSFVGGVVSAKKNFTFWTMSIGTALMIVGTGLLSSLPSNGATTHSQYGWEVILGFGLGLSVSTATFMTAMEVEFLDHAVTQGTVAQSRILGGSIAIAVTTMVMNNHIETALGGVVSPEVLTALYASPFTVQNDSVAVELYFRQSYVSAFANDMRNAMYVSAAAFIISLFAWKRHPPTVQERSEALAVAVRAYEGRQATIGPRDNEIN